MIAVRIVDEVFTRELRRSVLRPQLGPGEPLPGDELPGGVHLGALDADGTLVATCLVYADPCPWLPGRVAWHLRQMATLPDRRGEGHGAAVVAAATAYVGARRADVLWCNARETAAAFYERQGFLRHGAVFTDDRHAIPHVRMSRELRATPTSSR